MILKGRTEVMFTTSITIPTVQGADLLIYKTCSGIEDFSAITVKSDTMAYSPLLQTANYPICTTINARAFSNCPVLSSINFPACQTIYDLAFCSCISLTNISFPECEYIGTNAFQSCTSLTSIFLLGSNICSLADSNAFIYTPIIDSTYTGVFGSIYVPYSLMSEYKAAINWSYYSNRIVGV